jgi:hypothetical protein
VVRRGGRGAASPGGGLMGAVATEPGVEVRILICHQQRRRETQVTIEVVRRGPAAGGGLAGRWARHQRMGSPDEEEEDVRRRTPLGRGSR